MKPQILLGDCLEALKSMDNEEIFDLCLIDPPYFDYKTNHRQDKKGKLSQSLVQQDRQDQIIVVEECIKKLKYGKPFYFFTNWFEAYWFQSRFHSLLHNEIIWYKGNWTAGDLEGSFGSSYEVIFLGVKGKGWVYKGARLPDLWCNDTGLFIPRMGTNRIHPTEKPVDLYKKIIEISTEPGDFILDPYVGSGSSAEAAYITGRMFLGYEIDKFYHKKATERIGKLE